MPRIFVINPPQQEVKKQSEEAKVEAVVETKPKKKTVKKAEEETGDVWAEKQDSLES